MHEKALPAGSRRLLERLKTNPPPVLRGWTLAGGTGLALQRGHRLSEDFDFFRIDEADVRGLHRAVKAASRYETLQEAEHTLTVLAEGVKLSFFQAADPFLFAGKPYLFFHVADERDIALMKLAAIGGRGSRKNFVDLYTILRGGLTLRECFRLLPRKYGAERVNAYHLLKSVTFFEDAEREPMPRMLVPFNWDECKAFFRREAHAIVLPP